MLPDPPLTKRQLGWLIILLGALAALAVAALDMLNAGRFSGLGPLQLQALGGCALLMLFGVSLLPLGHRPA